MRLEQSLLKPVLEFELANAKRYGRYISLVKFDQGINEDKVRLSDGFFPDGTILMGETDKSGAITFIERLRLNLNGSREPRAGVVTFPFDGFETEDLLRALDARLEKAKSMSIEGAIITYLENRDQ